MVAVLETITTLPDLYVGKIVHFDQLERGVASSSRREPSVGYSAEMAPGMWHDIEDCHRPREKT